ncbi:hypothetical protein [Thalassotalea profundi]|uniref:Phage protein n=1 Tax=Thalassotalea profundi TaxID=2036687 RepID=A0ABQ3IMX2_9GAMM|nr:hypothetical protein [Thalassotalea profundi]GHE87414.1 hypothetical protein GCM10011501_16090 [Thalassotalea profundi]
MKVIKHHFKIALEKRKQANETSVMRPSVKMQLADEALDALQIVVVGLIGEIERLNERVNDENR